MIGDDPNEARERELRGLHAQGFTLEEIGSRLTPPVGRERVRQLLASLSLSIQGRTERRTDWLTDTRGPEIRAAFLRLRDDVAVAAVLGLSSDEVRRAVDRLVPDPRVLRSRQRPRQPNYSDAELIESLASAAAVLGQPLSHDAYNDWAKTNPMPDGRPRATHQTMALRWGSWRAALRNADLRVRPRGGSHSALSRHAVIAAVVECWRELNAPPTIDTYTKWSQREKSRPSPASVRKFVDGWGDAILSAWEIIHEITVPREDLPALAGAEIDPDEDENVKSVVGDTTEVFSEAEASARVSWQSYHRANEDAEPSEAELSRPDPGKLRSAVRAHARLQNGLADALTAAGLVPLSPTGEPEFDIAWRRQDGTLVLCEVKSTTPDSAESQMRAAVAQALRYQAQLEHRLGRQVLAAIFIEEEPDEIWQSLCLRVSIQLAWPSNDGTSLRLRLPHPWGAW